MVALYKGYKVFLANCTQFISAAADKLIALFKRHVLRKPPPPSAGEQLDNQEMSVELEQEIREELLQAKIEVFEVLFDFTDTELVSRRDKIIAEISNPILLPDPFRARDWPPSGGSVSVARIPDAWQTIWQARWDERESEGIIRHKSWSLDWGDGEVGSKGFVEQSITAQRERSLLFDRIRNSPHMKITSKDIEFIEQTVVNPDTNLETVYYVAAKLIPDLTSLEGEEFTRGLCRGEKNAREKMIELLKSFFGYDIAVQIFETMFGEA